MKTEIRKAIVVWMLNKLLGILPEGEFKVRYCLFIKDNIMKL